MNDFPDDDIPTFAELAADPEIAALLDFEPAPRKIMRGNGWTLERQRELIARLAAAGSVPDAADQMGRDKGGAYNLYRAAGADSFRAAWDAALALNQRRAAAGGQPYLGEVPGVTRRRPPAERLLVAAGPGQILNEHGEREDEASVRRRGEEARDSITMKLLRARRLYLQEICRSPGKRAAFEILTELPVDWDRAERLEAQPDEPFAIPNFRNPDMLLTAENGWLGDITYGRDKRLELRRAIDDYRAEEGLPAIDWSADDDGGGEQ